MRLIRQTRHNDDRNLRRLGLHLLQRVKSLRIRKGQVQQDDLDPPSGQAFQPRLELLGAFHLEGRTLLLGEHFSEGIGAFRIILNQQHLDGRIAHGLYFTDCYRCFFSCKTVHPAKNTTARPPSFLLANGPSYSDQQKIYSFEAPPPPPPDF